METTVPEPATATRRPSPYPRAAESASRPAAAHLRVVPEPEPAATLQPETATTENTPLDHVSAGHDHPDDAHDSPVAEPTAASPGLWARSKAYWTPPQIFTDRPASLAELADYAKYAPWTHQNSGLIRGAGIGYYRALTYPYTTVSRYREWVTQRPGRLLLHLAGVKLFALTGPGTWVVDHLVYPAAQFAGHVFL
jgi:hypothetical protein